MSIFHENCAKPFILKKQAWICFDSQYKICFNIKIIKIRENFPKPLNIVIEEIFFLKLWELLWPSSAEPLQCFVSSGNLRYCTLMYLHAASPTRLSHLLVSLQIASFKRSPWSQKTQCASVNLVISNLKPLSFFQFHLDISWKFHKVVYFTNRCWYDDVCSVFNAFQLSVVS